MKKMLSIAVFSLILLVSVYSEDRITRFEEEIKNIKNSVAPSLVKVVAENHKKYVATGIAIDRDMVLTSTLVVARPFDQIYVRTIDGRRYDAEIMGKDTNHAIILLKIKEKAMIPMPRSDALEEGDWIALVGVFYNKFPSIFQGIVSTATDEEVILNAPVFPGASGGAVVNKKGRLVAVIRGQLRIAVEPDISIIDNRGELVLRSAKLRNKNLCYAVPIQKVLKITEQIKKYGHVKRGWLGIYIQSAGNGNKARIARVVQGSPAERAGLREGDTVVDIGGKRIGTPGDISRIIRSYHPGSKVSIKVFRNNDHKVIPVTLGSYPDRGNHDLGNIRITVPRTPVIIPQPNGTLPRAKKFTIYRKGSKKMGIDVVEVTPGLAKKFDIREGYGLMISRVDEKSPAQKAGILEGDIIVRGNQTPLKTLTDIRRFLNNQKAGESVKITFYRDGKRRTVSVSPQITRDSFVEWDDFFSRSSLFSRFFGESVQMDILSFINQKLARLNRELNRVKRAGDTVSREKLESINEEISLLKRKLNDAIGKEFKRIQEQKQRIDGQIRKFREQERRIKDELEDIKKRLKKITGSDSPTV